MNLWDRVKALERSRDDLKWEIGKLKEKLLIISCKHIGGITHYPNEQRKCEICGQYIEKVK